MINQFHRRTDRRTDRQIDKQTLPQQSVNNIAERDHHIVNYSYFTFGLTTSVGDKKQILFNAYITCEKTCILTPKQLLNWPGPNASMFVTYKSNLA